MPGERAIKKGNVLIVYYRLSCEHYIQSCNHGNSDYPFNKKFNYFNFILIPKNHLLQDRREGLHEKAKGLPCIIGSQNEQPENEERIILKAM